jgi:hypothetical protein
MPAPNSGSSGTVANVVAVDFFRTRQQGQDLLHLRILPNARDLEQIRLTLHPAGVQVRQDALPCRGSQYRSRLRTLLPVAEQFLISVEEKLVLDHVATKTATRRILIQERNRDIVPVVEPRVAGE